MKIALVYTKIHPDQGGPWVSFDPSGGPKQRKCNPDQPPVSPGEKPPSSQYSTVVPGPASAWLVFGGTLDRGF